MLCCAVLCCAVLCCKIVVHNPHRVKSFSEKRQLIYYRLFISYIDEEVKK